ncbi:alpha-2-macroglobulin family protein [Bacteroides sp.]|uniref:alpha-2-macroglobulin family protein n=1 Tax=Bacteroides sp. TaxID=29523 RepID=UPI00260EB24F|nr:alpha-2-macroglobulin family protein [Bacteroides sp.]MDD3037104.1 alpha-2-macroglobulin family protein [Bacteroides sp.]
MNIKLVGIVMLLCLASIPGIQAQSFDELWKQVEQAEKNKLPRTLVDLTDKIYRKAEKKKDSPQMLKAYMWRMKYRETIAPDSFYINLEGLEQWVQQTKVPMDRAILHSLIAGIYTDYALQNRWKLQSQKQIVGKIPSDIKEWTANLFIEKIQMHTREALKDSVLLLKTSSRTYMPFVELGEASEYYHHDMYHLLASRSIEALTKIDKFDLSQGKNMKPEIATLYKNMISTYRKKEDKEGILLASLDYLRWQNTTRYDKKNVPVKGQETGIDLSENFYIAGLNELITDYQSLEVCAEVYRAKVYYILWREQWVTALQLCDEAIRLYPDYYRINILKNIRKNILCTSLSVDISSTAYPGEKIDLKANHKNLDGFTIQLYQSKNLISEQHYSLTRSEEYQLQDTVFTYNAPEKLGAYMMRVVPDNPTEKVIEKEFAVTRIKVLTCPLPQNHLAIFTLDAQTGYPIPNTRVTFYEGENGLQRFLDTGEDGKADILRFNYNYLVATKGDDTAMLKQFNNGGGVGRFDDNRVLERVILLTDKALYRPGQTVYVKGIAYKMEKDSTYVIPDEEYTLSLMDANKQEVGNKTLRTNDFGSFTTDFALPYTCLNGKFRLETPYGECNILVENYKRPTFDITFEKQQGSYQLGDEVQVKGKVQSYSGVQLQNLSAKYTIERLAYRLGHTMQNVQISSGEVMVDGKGEFSIPVYLDEDQRYTNDDKIYYHYQIQATVTNAAGETQTSCDLITAGNHSLNLQVICERKINKEDSTSVMFKVQNLSMQPMEMQGTYRLFRIKDKLMKELEEVPAVTGTFITNKAMKLDWKNIPSGVYMLKMSVKDNQDKEVEAVTDVALFSINDTRPPVETPVWFYKDNLQFDATHPAVFYYGTSEKDAYVMVNVFNQTELVESKVLILSDSIVRFEYPYKETYGDGITVNLCMAKNGKWYQDELRLEKRVPEDKLSMKWEVFRDKLYPGQKEEWKLTIKAPQGEAADAEMLAMMYDASLDKISLDQPMYFLPQKRRMLPFIRWRTGGILRYEFNYWNIDYLKTPSLEYDRFAKQSSPDNDIKLEEGFTTDEKVIGIAGRKISDENLFKQFKARTSANPNALTGSIVLPEKPYLAVAADIRTNLLETAFFYPQLRTNKQGEVSFSFTVPENLTRWNFRAYSHTKNMMLGTLNGEATTSKEFMLTPNLPRFVRVGDKTSIAASISNSTGKMQSGIVSMILFDPMTDKVISTQKQDFTVKAGKTIGVNFLFTATDEYEILGCRMIADSEIFSDGEQQLLSVLSNKEHLVETLPMPIRGEETRTFSLDTLFNRHSTTATSRKLTVEFAGNPSWYAVQALPSLALPTNADAFSWATAYYANTLATYILNNQPRIKSVFDSWKLQGGTKETFVSNLQKNQEVKNIILSESPWVLEAQTEEQQKERIATLFDLNNIFNNNSAALMMLKNLQNPDGGWSWYMGMDSSPYVTAFILGMNARLTMLTHTAPADPISVMQKAAFNYLHKSALKEYKEILDVQKKEKKFIGISGSILNYLYLIAISGEKVPAANKEAYTYYLSKVSELLSSSSEDAKAFAAIILTKAGKVEEAQKFIASLKEHLTKTDEQGMFFDFNDNPYTWSGMKLRTHVTVMEALTLVGGNDATLEEMKLWLLKQKQTQQWRSPLASVDAIYALLMKGTNLLNNQENLQISIANETFQTNSPDKTTIPGLGYIKRTFTQQDIVDARTIKVEKKSPGMAWGAVYAEYDSPIRNVKQQGEKLNVQKKLYVERMAATNTPQLEPITDKTLLRVGDKVISRLSIRVDRSMDFVQLRDQRGVCFEPIGNLSGYHWNNGLGYYIDIKDVSTNFFFDRLVKGDYILEYSYRVSREGTYETGMATLQCAYAPEYASYSGSMTVEVTK